MKWDSQLYQEKYAFVYKYGEQLVEMLRPSADERILDIGCGTGYLTSKIAEQCKEVVGLDLSEEMIANARKNYPKLKFDVGDATRYTNIDSFDAIFSNATLHWISNQERLNANMYSLLKKGGRLVVEFGGKDNVATILDMLRQTLAEKGYKKQSEIYPWYYPSIGTYATALESVGFRVVSAEHYNRPTPLADEEDSLKNWILMFGKYFFTDVSEKDKETILAEVEKRLKPVCYENGRWLADYKRIRVIAVKE